MHVCRNAANLEYRTITFQFTEAKISFVLSSRLATFSQTCKGSYLGPSIMWIIMRLQFLFVSYSFFYHKSSKASRRAQYQLRLRSRTCLTLFLPCLIRGVSGFEDLHHSRFHVSRCVTHWLIRVFWLFNDRPVQAFECNPYPVNREQFSLINLNRYRKKENKSESLAFKLQAWTNEREKRQRCCSSNNCEPRQAVN